MPIRTPAQFLEGLKDSREVYYRGERVHDVTQHPELGVASRHSAIDFEVAENPAYRDLAIARDDDGTEYSAYYRVPRSPQDLADRARLIEVGTIEGGTLVLLVKEIGTDALFALIRVLSRMGETEGLKRVEDFYRHCRDNDLTLAVAQSDVKGDRSKRPADPSQPDMYLRIVEERPDGIVVRGAKVHTSCSPNVDEIIVLPSRSMGPGDEAWSVSFAIPVATPNLRLYVSDYLHSSDDAFTYPVSANHKIVETLTVFDDVFVPWERVVFFANKPEVAGAAALTFVEYHRFTAVSYKLPMLDAFVGCAVAIAEANGISRAGHVREKLTWLIGYAETIRGLVQLAAQRAHMENGICYPDVFTTNLTKWTFARDYHVVLQYLQDLSGGLLVTGPSGKDWENPAIRPVLERYFGGAWPANERLAMLNLISDLTTRGYGGYHAVVAVHAEGSLEAEKIEMYRAYRTGDAVAYARKLAGI